jgi:toxin ParE1/3/4
MRRRRIVRRPAADGDVEFAAAFLAERDPEVADRFIDAVRATEEALLLTLGMGTLRDYDNSTLKGMRFHLVRGFRKYLIFYIPRDDGIEVVRVLHGARDLEALFRT